MSSFADTVLPGELLNDAPGTDRTDHALKARALVVRIPATQLYPLPDQKW